MEENQNFIIISEPRTGSQFTLYEYCKEYNRHAIPGLLYRPQNNFKYSDGTLLKEEIKTQEWEDDEILSVFNLSNHFMGHGHWHSLPYYNNEIIDNIKNNFKIINIERNPLEQLISIILLIRRYHPLYRESALNKNTVAENRFSQESISEGLDLILDWFFEMKTKSQEIKKQFNIHKTLQYELISEPSFLRTRKIAKESIIQHSDGYKILEQKLSNPKYKKIINSFRK
jgi:hypothetical protein